MFEKNIQHESSFIQNFIFLLLRGSRPKSRLTVLSVCPAQPGFHRLLETSISKRTIQARGKSKT
jgi:hypothetical protein